MKNIEKSETRQHPSIPGNRDSKSGRRRTTRGKASLTIALVLVSLILVSTPASAGLLRIYAIYQSLPLEDVLIQLTDTETGETYNTTTQPNGTATIDLPNGTYEMTATHDNYTTQPKTIQVDNQTTSTTLSMNDSDSEEDEDGGSTGLIIALLIIGGVIVCLFVYYMTVQKDMVLGIFNSSSATEFAKSPDKDERAGKFLGGLFGGGSI